MTPNRIGILVSLTLHGGVVSLALVLSTSFAHIKKPVEIDLTMLEPVGPPSPPPPPPKAPINKLESPAPAPAKMRQTAPQPVRKQVPHEPATQTEGMVPVLANPNKMVPVPEHAATQALQGVPGGTGTGSVSAQGTGGGGGIAAEQLRRRYQAEHYAYIKKIIEENVVYPERAKRLGWVGRCVVQFVILENGHTRDIRILKSTGYELLDDNIVEAIRRVEPFPKPPVSATLKIPFTYGLE